MIDHDHYALLFYVYLFVSYLFNLFYVHLSIYSSGSHFTRFRPCSIQSFIGTILMIDTYRTSLYPDLRNNAGTVSTLLRTLLSPLTLPTIPFQTRRLNSHLFPSHQKSVTLRIVHQIIHPSHRSRKQLPTALHAACASVLHGPGGDAARLLEMPTLASDSDE